MKLWCGWRSKKIWSNVFIRSVELFITLMSTSRRLDLRQRIGFIVFAHDEHEGDQAGNYSIRDRLCEAQLPLGKRHRRRRSALL